MDQYPMGLCLRAEPDVDTVSVFLFVVLFVLEMMKTKSAGAEGYSIFNRYENNEY